jgi:hypothetical protein
MISLTWFYRFVVASFSTSACDFNAGDVNAKNINVKYQRDTERRAQVHVFGIIIVPFTKLVAQVWLALFLRKSIRTSLSPRPNAISICYKFASIEIARTSRNAL